MTTKNYDFIIVGGGSAGCVLANRLSADPNINILILEAGVPDYRLDFRLHMPSALSYPLQSKTYNWWYESEPEPYMQNRRIYQPRGKVLGGSSSINGMIWIRGNPLDFESWGSISGLETWNYSHCLPYFLKVENKTGTEQEYRGTKGPLFLSTGKCENPLFKAFFRSVKEAGYPVTKDVNGYQQEGFSAFDQTIHKGRRLNAARAYLHPIRNRKNIKIITEALVCKILFKNKKAVGIEYKRKKKIQRVFAGETILSAGAINSPQILQLSGIGPSKLLKKHDIPLIENLEGVGQNLQDHLEVYIQWACKKPVSLYPMLNPLRAPWIGFTWLFLRKGIGTSNHFEAGGFIRSNKEVKYPNLQFHFLPLAIRYDGTLPQKTHGFQLHVGPVKSDATGHIEIQSKDPEKYPKIKFNYLSTQKDRKEWCEAIHCARKIIETDSMKEFRGSEISPGKSVQKDEDILNFVGRDGESAYHPSCSCKMGYDSMSVVDSSLKVHEVQNLRIVDASVMPSITNGNIYAPTMMIAEKASDIILGKGLEKPQNLSYYKI